MTVIEANQGVITTSTSTRTIAILREAARTVTHLPGWMSANLHVSLDHTQLTPGQ